MPEADTKELSTKQRHAIAHMLVARNVEEAAKAAGVSERTLFRWLGERAFYAALCAAENDAIDYAVRKLVSLADPAVEALKGVLDDDKASPATKIRAALGILESLVKLRELRNIETRLSALEQAYYGDKKPSEY